MQPRGNASIVNLGQVDFDALNIGQLQGLSYESDWIPANADASNQLINGNVFAVHTNDGSYAKVKVVNYDYNLTIR